MKTLARFLCLTFLLSFLFIVDKANGNIFASTTYYAQIYDASTALYSTKSDSQDNIVFFLPQTYFVELLSQDGEYYYARYFDVYGYVKKEKVKPVKTSPITPFLTDVSFRIFVPSGASLRQSPQNLGATNLVYTIPFLDNNLQYYGTATGDEAISKKGNIWYYCKYFCSNQVFFGYVYSPLCDCLGEFAQNTETVEYIEGKITFEDETKTTSTNPMEQLSSTAQTVIVIVVCLPCLLFIYLLIKPTQIAESVNKRDSSSGHKSKKKISRLKHSDFYELDDDF